MEWIGKWKSVKSDVGSVARRVVQGKRKMHAKDGSQPWKAKNKAKKSAGDCVDGSSGLEARGDRSRYV